MKGSDNKTGTKKKILICLSLCFLMLLVGLILAATVAVGVWIVLKPQPQFSINITSTLTSGQAFSDGFIILEFSLPSGISLQDNIVVYLDGVEKFSLKFFPTTLEIPTDGLEDGNHNVSIVAISLGNSRGFGEIIVLVEDPKLTLVTLDYPGETYPNATLTITVEVSGNASHFVANLTSLFGQTTFFNSSQSGELFISTILIPGNLIAEERIYSIPLVVYSTVGRTLKVPGIEIFFQNGQTNPFIIEEGIIDMQSFPTVNTTDSTLNFTLPASLSITTGQSVEVPIEVGSPDVSEVLVGFEGFGQHFIVPISSLQNQNSQRRSTRQANSEIQTLLLIIELPPGSIESGEQISMLIRLRNNYGGYGPIVIVQFTTSTSQLGTLHVRLTWYLDVDMDLHVVDPNTEEIYYAHSTSSGQVGFLDLDSNAACNLDHIRIENIYYELAISGQYIVRVDLYDSCIITEQINFDVFVEGCGYINTVSGSFQHTDADGGSAGSGIEVLVFNVSCPRYRVDGTVSYKTLLSKANPQGSIVRVVDDQGNVLGSSQIVRDVTDTNQGSFSVPYDPIDENDPVYVEILSSNNKVEVTDHPGNVHVFRVIQSIIPNIKPTATIVVLILLSDGAGAFNIMVTLTRMLPTYLAYGGKTSDYPLIANWELGKYARDAQHPISYFSQSLGIIFICGHVMDPDESDPSVLLRVMGQLIMFGTGAVLRGVGYHDGSPISPSFAFYEGFATYLGQRVIGNLMYCDSNWCFDISNIYRLVLGTTESGRSSGDISEWVVAGVAYRLDTESGLGATMALALHKQDLLLLPANYERLGSRSAVDLSDMVSLIVCDLDVTIRNKVSNLLIEYSLPWIAETGFCLERN